MPIPRILQGKLALPVIGAPLFIVSGPELVIAQCKAGIVGAPVRDRQTGATAIPIAHRIDGPQGMPLGAVVGLVPAADLIGRDYPAPVVNHAFARLRALDVYGAALAPKIPLGE